MKAKIKKNQNNKAQINSISHAVNGQRLLSVRLKDASDAKLTVDGRSYHTFATLSAKKPTRPSIYQ